MSDANWSEVREAFCRTIRGLWGLMLIRGVLLILIGVYAVLNPGATLAALAWMIGVYLLLEGGLAVYLGLTKKSPTPVWAIIRGLVLILVGLFAVAKPGMFATLNVTFLVCFIAVGLVFSGVAEIYFAIRERHNIEGEGWLMLSGLVSILFGAIMLASPLMFGIAFMWVVGVFAIIGGISLIATAFRFRSFGRRLAA